MRPTRIIGLIWLLFVGGIFLRCAESNGQDAVITAGTLDRLHEPILRQDLKVNGAQSCATANCHGGPRPGVAQPWARRGSEYSLWIENDPHAKSWRTMCGEEALAMMRRLRIMEGDKVIDRAGFDNCLACHNSTKRYSELRRQPTSTSSVANDQIVASCLERSSEAIPDDVNSFSREGVGCSSCHGPSERWIDSHYQESWSSTGATRDGFVEASDVYVRARMCASCHIGDKDRDMNHDIIAAGHPPLRYELATYHAWQPKHWRDAEAADRTRYEAQLWFAGQIAATDASLSLLQTRASKAHTVSEWPELASFDCASCHHDLGLRKDRVLQRGLPQLSSWNDAGLRWLLQYRRETGIATTEDGELVSSLDAARRLMESAARPDPIAVASAALDARMALARWFDGQPGQYESMFFDSERLGRTVASAAGKPDTFSTWESSVQFYLAAVAARESWPGGWNGPMQNIAEQLRFGLSYPDMLDIDRHLDSRESIVPTLDRRETTKLGIELAGWLGPVSPDQMVAGEDDEKQQRKERKAMLDRIEKRWQGSAEKRAKEFAEMNAAADERERRRAAEEPTVPPRRIKSAEELKNELRNRIESDQLEPSDDD